MIQLRVPDIDNDVLLDNIIGNKKRIQRDKLTPYKNRIKARYRHYEEHYNSLEDVNFIDVWEPVKEELLSCYGSNIAFSEAKKRLVESMPIVYKCKCPYCMLSRPNTLDHYFDKSDYPEFSVFIPNLILCCSECNSLKGTKVFSDDGERIYLHYYHDNIPIYQFLFIRFRNTDELWVPEIGVSLHFQDDEPLAQLITTHFRNLKLLHKYKLSINDKLSAILREIKYAIERRQTYPDISANIEDRYRSMVDQYGRNYWEACIYEGVLNSPGYLRSIVENH